jgi:hypothetical protein
MRFFIYILFYVSPAPYTQFYPVSTTTAVFFSKFRERPNLRLHNPLPLLSLSSSTMAPPKQDKTVRTALQPLPLSSTNVEESTMPEETGKKTKK